MAGYKKAAHRTLGLLLGVMMAGCAGPPLRRPPQSIERAAAPDPQAVNPPASIPPATGPAKSPPAANPSEPMRPATLDIPQSPAPVPGQPAAAPRETVPLSPADNVAQLRRLYREAADRYATIDSYIARVRRREQVNGKDKPEEVLVFKFRKQPWSVYFKFIGTEGQGREVVYVQGQYGNQIHTLLAAGDIPFSPGGKRMAVSPDSIFVRKASRHPITDAGIGYVIERFGIVLEAFAKGDTHFGTMHYLGRVKRPEFAVPVEAMECIIPPGINPLLPRGGRRQVMFDPVSHLPTLILSYDETGHEVEYGCYDRLEFPVKLDDNDFNPDKLWPPKPGMGQ